MEIKVLLKSGGIHKAREPYNGSRFVTVEGVRCPKCNAPLAVYSPDCNAIRHDTFGGRAFCAADQCDEYVGEIEVKMSTIFGVEEDSRVLNGRARVY